MEDGNKEPDDDPPPLAKDAEITGGKRKKKAVKKEESPAEGDSVVADVVASITAPLWVRRRFACVVTS